MKRKKLVKHLKKKIKRCVSIPFINISGYTGMNMRFDDISLIDEKNKLSIISHNIIYNIKKKKAYKLKKYIIKHYRRKTNV